MVCNVSSALRKVGLMSQSSHVYERKKADAGFGAKWEAAIRESYSLLELEMLERARVGDDRPAPRTEVEKRLREIPERLALQLLKLHQSRERGRAKFAGAFPELEDELAGLTIGGGYEGPGRSPDRADAMVWAFAELMPGKKKAEPRVRFL